MHIRHIDVYASRARLVVGHIARAACKPAVHGPGLLHRGGVLVAPPAAGGVVRRWDASAQRFNISCNRAGNQYYRKQCSGVGVQLLTSNELKITALAVAVVSHVVVALRTVGFHLLDDHRRN